FVGGRLGIRIPHLGALARRAALALPLAAIPGPLAGQEVAAPRRSPDVHFVPTQTELVRAMLDVAKVGAEDVVYDLGCGDGRIVITAVKRYGARRGVCVDIDPERIAESRRNADTAGVAGRISFENADLFTADLREATVVTLYLLPELNERLRPKLFRELRPGTRIVSNTFDMGAWKPDSTVVAKPPSGFQKHAHFWIIPADVAGTWRVRSDGAGNGYSLQLEQEFQMVTGTAETAGRTIPLEDVRLSGDRLRFTLDEPGGGGGGGAAARGRLRFEGVVTGERVGGTVRRDAGPARAWSAERVERGSRPELGPEGS
ncbi:MAG TPA: class I SAM-dependent methyltransferase, partial [Gemmatimonadales bacterium]|nr:class I SAM-dependent methyltransferase [Gemmatimonadales bacterium]